MEQPQPKPPIVLPPINEYGRVDSASYLKLLTKTYGFAMLLIQVFAMPGEVLLRRRFGERYLDPMMVMLGFVGLFVLGATSSLLGEERSVSLILFAFGYLALAVSHRLAILHRDLKGEAWHSQSAGLPWPWLTWPAKLAALVLSRLTVGKLGQTYEERLRATIIEYLQIFVEPVFMGVVSVVLVKLDISVGAILPVIASAMLIRSVLERHMDRTRVLDAIDATIEAEHRIDVLTGAKQPEEAQGFKVSGVRLPASVRSKLAQMYQGNDVRRADDEIAST